MRPGRLPENHPKEKEARSKLRIPPPQKEKPKPEKVLPSYKPQGF